VTTLLTIALVGLLIALHEAGHFAAAKLSGVKVLSFSVGFGPRVVSRRLGETEYRLSLIPLGGYVQLLNEPPRDPAHAARERGRSMEETSPWLRALIFAAGPGMNLVLPFLLLPCLYLLGHDIPAYRLGPAEIGYVASGSAADHAGLLAGDRVLRANGRAVDDWQALAAILDAAGAAPITLQVAREGGIEWLEIGAAGDASRGLGLYPTVPPLIADVFPDSPAAVAGLRARDRIVSIDGRPVDSWYAFTEAIDRSGGRALALTVRRQGDAQTVEVIPRRDGARYMVGVSVVQSMVRQQHPPREALKLGLARASELIGMTFGFIADFVTGRVGSDQIGGPVEVFRMTGAAIEASLAETLFMLAFLSIQLGVLNLLPIPVLDGGHLLLLLPEVATRRPLPLRLREGLQGIGLALVLGLMLLAFYNDLSRLL